MSRYRAILLLALCAAALPASIALAQRFPFGARGQDITRPGRVSDADAPTCQSSGGGSRIRSNCDDPEASPTAVARAAKIAVPAAAQLAVPSCAATTVTEYLQEHTTAHVNGTITVKSCAAAGSSGTYEIVLRVKEGSGAVKSLEFSEGWKGSETQDVPFAASYPLGENVELLDVRMRNLRCTCADAATEPTQTGPGGGD
ncbi:MAG TPA: hypothetical protein VFO94_13805 [Gammaproteobacteria bacterium]|nr:hypothetical protein [Gammaproteobacteria bacterium]